MHRLVVFFLLTVAAAFMIREYMKPVPSDTVISAPAGKLRGAKANSLSGRSIVGYYGIPYATPPVDKLKFAKTQPIDEPAWEGIKEAFSFGSACLQRMPWGGSMGDEDCLYLNVFVPEGAEKKKNPLPVMVFIHGGGFHLGTASSYMMNSPENLLDRDVILVTLNYRLNVYGFLNLGTEEAPGNQGLWDQRQALKWVQRNIASFSGDPKAVTVFGISAGGMSVAYHLISEGSEGLFRSAIVQSGALHSSLLYSEKYRKLPDVHGQVVKNLGCNPNGSEVMECLWEKPPSDFFDQLYRFDECTVIRGIPVPAIWQPSEDVSFASDPFFSASPLKLVEQNKVLNVPIMIGITRDEGLIASAQMHADPESRKHFENNLETCVVQNVLGVTKQDVTDLEKKTYKEIVDFYFGGKESVDFLKQEHSVTAMFGESIFGYGADLAIRKWAPIRKVFSYRYDHVGSFSLADYFAEPLYSLPLLFLRKMFGIYTTKGLGASHGDDQTTVFASKGMVRTFPEEKDYEHASFMADLWANFATYGTPTPKDDNGKFVGRTLQNSLDRYWSPATGKPGKYEYVRLADGAINFEEDKQYNERLKFWRNLLG